MADTLLQKDAVNRALRTLWQNVGVDILVACAVFLLPLVTDAEHWADFDWKVIGFSLAKTVVLTVLAYIMRRYLDKSKIPTPLPPEPAADPSAEHPEG